MVTPTGPVGTITERRSSPARRQSSRRPRCLLFGATAFACAGAAAQSTEIGDVFRSALACQVAHPSLADMPVAPLYRFDNGACVADVVDGDAIQSAWYLDAACSASVTLESTSLSSWCDTLLDAPLLGEGAGTGAEPAWTLSPGSRLDLGARSLDGVPQPWVAREIFRTVDTPRGRCSLEMQIHAPAPVVDGRVADSALLTGAAGRAMIAWHGGSWSSRGFGSFGLGLTVPHFTARGFTVYVPFYRLLGDSEGSPACNEAAFEADIVSDAFAAFDWVRDNGARYGTSGRPVLFGQSAGGQLAARIAVDRPDEVAGAVLYYTPSDFTDFVLRARSGAYRDEQGLGILARVLGSSSDTPAGQSLSVADVSASPIAANSLPQRIVRDGVQMPPMFLLHGDEDTLVEARQSVRLCDALAGRELLPVDQEAPDTRGLREVTECSAGSSLHRVSQGQHALDVCLLSAPLPLDSCLSGSEFSRGRVADAIGSSAVFAQAVADDAFRTDFPELAGPAQVLQVDDEPNGAGGRSGGSGALGPLVTLALLLGSWGGRCRRASLQS